MKTASNRIRSQVFIDVFRSYIRSKIFGTIYLFILGIAISLITGIPLYSSLLFPIIAVLIWGKLVLDDVQLLCLYCLQLLGLRPWYYLINESLIAGGIILTSNNKRNIPLSLKFDAIVTIYDRVLEGETFFLGQPVPKSEWGRQGIIQHIIFAESNGSLSFPALTDAAKFIDSYITNGKRVYCHDLTCSVAAFQVIMAYLMKYESSRVHEAYIRTKVAMKDLTPFQEASSHFKHMIEYEKSMRSFSRVR